MSDFDLEPLLRGERDPLVREVLGAAKEERPASGARGRALAALGLGATSMAIPAQSTPARRSISTRLREALGIKGAIGLASIAVLGALTVFGSASMDRPALPEQAPALAPRDPARAPAPPSAPENVVSPETVTVPSIITPESLPSSEVPSRPRTAAPRSAATAPPPAMPPTSTLGRETELVDAAGRALSRGVPSEALESLDAYKREFPKGTFALEVSVLRIEALARAGRSAEADGLAADFLAQHPTGPHARRVQAAQSRR